MEEGGDTLVQFYGNLINLINSHKTPTNTLTEKIHTTAISPSSTLTKTLEFSVHYPKHLLEATPARGKTLKLPSSISSYKGRMLFTFQAKSQALN